MALYHNPRIVTSGLVLALDTASPTSYPGSGNTINDLSGNGFNGTLMGSPQFSTDNHGILDFDGIDDYITCGTSTAVDLIQNQTNFSLGVWFKMDVLGTLRGLIGTLNYNCTRNLGLTANGTSLAFYNDTTTCYAVQVGGVEIGKWIYGVGTYDGTTTRTYMFKDGNLTQSNGTSKSGATNTFSSDFQVWGDQNGTIETDCKGGLAHVYNRTLSQTEIEQNYNACKSRFGL
jgi:hypothetical protein|tara:strand:+ start:196 stop:888 length:693 start_codon:yes stop_codon:yes gene_type:complete